MSSPPGARGRSSFTATTAAAARRPARSSRRPASRASRIWRVGSTRGRSPSTRPCRGTEARLAKSKIPDPIERRHLVEKSLPPAQALAIAEAYLADDRHIEAIDFLKIAAADEQLAELRRRSIADGNAFLLRAV